MLDQPMTEREIAALNSKSALQQLSLTELQELRAKVFDNSRQLQSMRGLKDIDAEIRWREMNRYG